VLLGGWWRCATSTPQRSQVRWCWFAAVERAHVHVCVHVHVHVRGVRVRACARVFECVPVKHLFRFLNVPVNNPAACGLCACV
jgi:hypothetical protein